MDDIDFIQQLRERFLDNSPHMAECGLFVSALSTEGATVTLPYRKDWLGDVESGRINPGIISVLVDSTAGLAVLARVGRREAIATLDLRIDHLRPAFASDDIYCHAECLRMTRGIAFVRATVWQHDELEPIASSQLAFMRTSARRATAGLA